MTKAEPKTPHARGGDLRQMASFAEPDQNLLAIVEGMPGSVALLDRNMCFVALNARFERDLGLPREEVIGRNYFELSPTAVQWRGAFEQCLAGRTIKADRVRAPNRHGTYDLFQSANIPWRDAWGGGWWAS